MRVLLMGKACRPVSLMGKACRPISLMGKERKARIIDGQGV